MTVTTKEQAWTEANKIFPTDYDKDEAASTNAGYTIYRHHTLNPYNKICDLGNRLEILTGEYGEITTNIWIEPEIIKNMGTKMNEDDYLRLVGRGVEYELTEDKAKIFINREYGFEASRIKIITEVETYYKDGNAAKVYHKYERTPQYCATDYNYVRFDVNGWQYEAINGSLSFYYN